MSAAKEDGRLGQQRAVAGIPLPVSHLCWILLSSHSYLSSYPGPEEQN